MRPHHVYIAGAYSGPWYRRIRNILRAVKAAVALAKKGHIPWCPHAHTCLWWLYGWGLSWDAYMQISLAQVYRCDWLLFLGHSPGADRELAAAEARGMPVYYSIDEVPDVDPQA